MNGCRYRGVSYLQRVPGARTSSEKNVSCNQLSTTAKVVTLELNVDILFLWLFYFYQSADEGEKLRRVLKRSSPCLCSNDPSPPPSWRSSCSSGSLRLTSLMLSFCVCVVVGVLKGLIVLIVKCGAPSSNLSHTFTNCQTNK